MFRALQAAYAEKWVAQELVFREQAGRRRVVQKMLLAPTEEPCIPAAGRFAAQSFAVRAFADARAVLRVFELAPEVVFPVSEEQKQAGVAEPRHAGLPVVRLSGLAEQLELAVWAALRDRRHAAQPEEARSALLVSQPALRAWLPAQAELLDALPAELPAAAEPAAEETLSLAAWQEWPSAHHRAWRCGKGQSWA